MKGAGELELADLPKASLRTLQRDFEILRRIGLDITFDKISKSYRANYDDTAETIYSDNKAENRFIDRVKRLCDVMQNCDEYVPEWYKEHYPDLSRRTRQRDLDVMREMGFNFKYRSDYHQEYDEKGKWRVKGGYDIWEPEW
jgi:predicted DNA-binding transcriptional regulator YafY